MKRYNHLYEQVCSFENLYAAATKAFKGKRSKPAATSFFGNLEDEIMQLRAELCSETYCHGGYRYFEIHEPKQRTVAAAGFRDRVVHHAIIRVIEHLFEKRFISDSYACRTGKGTHAGMQRAAYFTQRYKFALKCDIRKYFQYIDHEILLDMFKRVIKDSRLINLLAHIFASHTNGERLFMPDGGLPLFDRRLIGRGLPVGNLTSQFAANVYLNSLDHFVKHTLRCKGYVRYMDDFLLFSNEKEQLRQWGSAVKMHVDDLRLEIHPDKYRLLRCDLGVDFCGFVVFNNNRIRIRTATVRRFHRRYKHNLEALKNCRINLETMSLSVNAWLGHVKHAQSGQLQRLILGNTIYS
jgi:RNA-directed DNA polymerase